MITIEDVTTIHAPIARCFELALNIDLEVEAAQSYQLQPIGGVTSGVIGLGQRVRWKTKQFGLWITHTSEITALERSTFFQDRMVQGIFRSFRHDHYFRALNSGQTEMRDSLCFSMPVLFGGALAERFVVRKRLTQLLHARNQTLRQTAEGDRPVF